jgi:hypothetical protein
MARTYVHAGCGETIISGEDYVLLECPFRPIESTFCSCCGQLVPLSSVAWSDTGENIAKYRERLYASVPFWRRVYLMTCGNAYEGAVALNLDSHGNPKSDQRQPVG